VKLASVSVDLDTLPHYCRIHGLPESLLDEEARASIWNRALPRLLEAFDRHRLRSTLFAIGEDLGDAQAGEAVAAAAGAGHEIASHSHAHAYDLSRWELPRIEADLRAAHEAIRSAVGTAPVGFRAPGYTVSAPLYQAVAGLGYRYDSSTFPSAPYYAAKALVMGAMRVVGRRSRSVLDSPGVLAAPLVPYRPDPLAPYRRGPGEAIELPIAVAPVTRLPFIGTLVTTWATPALRPVFATLRGREFLNLELHAVDALGAEDRLPAALVRAQPDLRLPVATKLARLEQVFEWIAGAFEPVPLADAAERFSARV
jgi:peptidoglycan/xylan/chitin deacetylase (PgdA/CDA1 family)